MDEIYPFGINKIKSKEKIPKLNWKLLSNVDKKTIHKKGITGLEWLPENMEMQKDGTLKPNNEKKSYQFVTTATDGQFFVWDIRINKIKRGEIAKMKNEKLKNAWIPFTTFSIPKIDSSREFEANCLSIGKIPDKFVSANLNGEVFVGNFSQKNVDKSEEDADTIKQTDQKNQVGKETIFEEMSNRKDSHFGPGYSVDYHKYFSDIFLSVGQFSFKIWKDSCSEGPLITSPISKKKYTCGKWSPTRFGVLYLGTEDGCVEVWDFLDKSNQPTTVMKLTQLNITSFDFKTINIFKSRNSKQYSEKSS